MCDQIVEHAGEIRLEIDMKKNKTKKRKSITREPIHAASINDPRVERSRRTGPFGLHFPPPQLELPAPLPQQQPAEGEGTSNGISSAAGRSEQQPQADSDGTSSSAIGRSVLLGQSVKQNIGHLLWSVTVEETKNNIANQAHKGVHLIVHCERPATNTERSNFTDEIGDFKFSALVQCVLINNPVQQIQKYDFEKTMQCCASEENAVDEHGEKKWECKWDLKNSIPTEGKHIFVTRVRVKEFTNYGAPCLSDVIVVNGRQLNVNKYILAGNSRYFRTFFFRDGFKEFLTQNFQITDSAMSVDLFECMLKIIMEPSMQHINDENVEELLRMADRFSVPLVTEQCERFLLGFKPRPSRQPLSQLQQITKFRLAEQFGLVSLKCHVLERLEPNVFCCDFAANLDEYNLLSERSKHTWNQCIQFRSKELDEPGKKRVRFEGASWCFSSSAEPSTSSDPRPRVTATERPETPPMPLFFPHLPFFHRSGSPPDNDNDNNDGSGDGDDVYVL